MSAKLLVGSIAVALVISLGIVWGSRTLGYEANAAVAAAMGAVGAAVFAARVRVPPGHSRR